ncbi:hypothetical protein [uncultured Maricaulis sp.]|uniref:hypothetical protein n=1 Tax=uncultured Maricaulis sp. TaxID=174710 RepID=UPI0030D85107|tara:strand:+ start:15914 stop:17551 length:1638 start_codon:yes stop_codon:yes gene_type:complete
MKHALIGAAVAALLTGLAPVGSAQAQHMSRLDRSAADQALAMIGLDHTDENRISFERADFRSGIYTFTNVTFHYTPDADDVLVLDEATDGDAASADDVSDPTPQEIHAARMIFDSPRLDADGNLLLHSFALEGVSASDDDGSFSVDQVTLEAPNPEMSADLGRLLRGDEADAIGSRWDLYRFGLLAMNNLAVTGSEPGEVFTMRLDRLAFRDYTADALDRFEFLGLAVEAETEDGPVTVGLAEVSADGLKTSSYSSLMEALASGADEAALTSAYYAADPEDQMDLFDRALIRDLDVVAPGMTVTLDEFVMTTDERNDRLETHAHMGSLRLVPDTAQATGAELAAAIGMLGYEDLALSLEANTVYDSQAGRAYTTGDNYLELHDGLRLDFAQDFGGYREYLANMHNLSEQISVAETPEETTELTMQAIAPLTINRLGLRLEDLSLLDRAISAGAASQGLTPDELRAQSGLMIAAGMMGAPPEVPRALLVEAATALTSFVSQGGALVIEMVPPAPLTIGDLMAQAEAEQIDFTALGLSITAEPPAGD